MKKSYQQDELLVFKWMAEDFKRIKTLANEAGAEIFFGDESTVRSDYHSKVALWKLSRIICYDQI
jgi:hypothetical protein